jgi:hypothetical protein
MTTQVKINRRAVAHLLKSPEVLADVRKRANRIAAAAGPGHEVDARIGRTRARASVVTATTEARRGEANRRTLTRALGAGR